MILSALLLLLLPAVLLLSLWRGRFQSRGEWALEVLMTGLYLAFVFQTGRWDFFSVHLRWLFPALLLGMAYRSYPKDQASLSPRRPGFRGWTGLVAKALFSGALLFLNLQALGGRSHDQLAVELAFPLEQGSYYVGGGGNSRWINGHQAHPPQRFAIDVVRLNGLGARAFGLEPSALDRYSIFGDKVFSPCAGRVTIAVDKHPDLTPPLRDSVNLAGNHVVIACHGVKVLLAHLQQGSVTIAQGEFVKSGQMFGRVGNSGNSTQPHLHIHAERGGAPDRVLDGEAVPIHFAGEFLVRNAIVR